MRRSFPWWCGLPACILQTGQARGLRYGRWLRRQRAEGLWSVCLLAGALGLCAAAEPPPAPVAPPTPAPKPLSPAEFSALVRELEPVAPPPLAAFPWLQAADPLDRLWHVSQPLARPLLEDWLARGGWGTGLLGRLDGLSQPFCQPVLAKPETVKEADTSGDDTGLTADDTVIQAYGPFARKYVTQTRADGQKEQKDVLLLQRDVLLAQPRSQQSLRAQKVELVRDLATGDVESLTATERVEYTSPDLRGKGQELLYETRWSAPLKAAADAPPRKLVSQKIYLRGALRPAVPAQIVAANYTLDAPRFEVDQRRDIFLALGGTHALFKLPPPATPPVPPPAAAPVSGAGAGAPAGNSLLPGMSFVPGQPIDMRCEGELRYEGYSGRLTLKRNVRIVQEPLVIGADEMVLILDTGESARVAAAAGPASGSAPRLLAGDVLSLECQGRVEVGTGTHVFFCDHALYDLKRQKYRMERESSAHGVYVYFREADHPERAYQVVKPRHRIYVDAATYTISDQEDRLPQAVWTSQPYKGLIPKRENFDAQEPKAPPAP